MENSQGHLTMKGERQYGNDLCSILPKFDSILLILNTCRQDVATPSDFALITVGN